MKEALSFRVSTDVQRQSGFGIAVEEAAVERFGLLPRNLDHGGTPEQTPYPALTSNLPAFGMNVEIKS